MIEYKDDSIHIFKNWVKGRWEKNIRPHDIAVMALGLGGEAAEVAEEVLSLMKSTGHVQDRIKKEVRGSGPADTENLVLEMGDVLHYWCCICNRYGLDPDQIMRENIKKLDGRDKLKTSRAQDGPVHSQQST